MLRLILPFCFVTLTLSGCRIKGIQVDEDDSDGDSTTESQTTGGSTSGGGGEAGGAGGNAGAGATGAGGESFGEWELATGDLKGREAPCAFGVVASSPHEDALITGALGQGLWKSADGGSHWQPLGTGADSVAVANDPTFILFDPDARGTFWEAGIDGPGIFKTTDAGVTFAQVGDVENVDYLSVDFSDPDRQTLLAGADERELLHLSLNGGTTWEDIGQYLPEDCTSIEAPYVLDESTFLLGCDGIFRSDDAGMSWARVSNVGGVGQPLHASDGSFYWASGGAEGLVQSTDDGKTWHRATAGGVLNPFSPIELPDHNIAAVGLTALVVSEDQGNRWKQVSPDLPNNVRGFLYAERRQAFYLWTWSCVEEVVGNEIQTYGYEP